MSCEICGRSSCTKSFHSLEAQEEFDRLNKTDEIRDNLQIRIVKRLDRIKGEYIEDDYYIKLSDAIEAVQSA